MPTRSDRNEAYFAVNLRADGPIPGICSLQVLEMTLVGESRNGQVHSFAPHLRSRFQIELRPLGRPFDSASQSWLAAESLRLAASGVPVGEAMVAASGWVRNTADGRHAVPVTWPGGIEGVHLQHYFAWRGDGSTPFRRSQVANNIELVNLLLGEDHSLIAGIRARGVTSASTADASSPNRATSLTAAANLFSIFR